MTYNYWYNVDIVSELYNIKLYSCTDGLTVQFVGCSASDVHPSWLNTVVPSYPHFFPSSSYEFTARSALFNYQGLTAAPAVTWLPKVASDHLLGLSLAWVGGGGTVSLHPITGPLFRLTNIVYRTTTLTSLLGTA